jgi:hypothetical protein
MHVENLNIIALGMPQVEAIALIKPEQWTDCLERRRVSIA